ncbi:MAG: tRNA (adenosine(37)-N6)-threonylcarbamoyltransferase complex dimerization subunit type 1 TsaB [Chthoniobacterales bacterium]
MKILALELSSARGSLAWRDGDLEWARDWPNDRKNSGEFFQNLAEVQKQFGAPARIVVGLGPGSYAGTRIAISAAIGLQLATKAELIGLPSLCAIECDAPEYAVVGDARRQSFFLARVRARIVSAPPALQSEAELRSALAILSSEVPVFAFEELRQFEGVLVRYPSAEILARLAAEENRAFVLPPLEPMYLREPHITTPKQK